MAFTRLPLATQSAYRDVLDRHLARPEPEIRGRVLRVEKGGRHYWVARRRLADRMQEVQIGPDTAEVRARADGLSTQNEDRAAWSERVAPLVSQLRATRVGVPIAGAGKILRALDLSGAFERGVVLIGTHAFDLYQLELGVRFDAANTATEDMDMALDRAVRVARQEAGLGAVLPGIGLSPLGGPGTPNPVSWRTEDDLVIDWLMQRGRGGRAIDRHPDLKIWAQTLPYLEFSLVQTIPAVSLWREGARVRIPDPARYAVHKLIVAGLRTGSWRQKVRKDLAQAEALIGVLSEDRPEDLGAALRDAQSRGPKWRQALDRTLEAAPDLAAMLDMS